MKIIDLLNKIANGEEVPEKFKFKGRWFEFDGARYVTNDGDEEILDYIIGTTYLLNAEVEIKEEEKEIEKLGYCCVNKNGETRNFVDVEEVLKDKINELIDVINDMRDKE